MIPNLQRDAHSSRLIVCERSGEWANLLRRSLPDEGRWIVETRGFKQLADTLDEHPDSFSLIDITPDNLLRVLATVERLHHLWPRSYFVVGGQRAVSAIVRSAACALREAGAAHVIHSPREVDVIGQLWRRHCQLHPPREATLREQVFASLPWSA